MAKLSTYKFNIAKLFFAVIMVSFLMSCEDVAEPDSIYTMDFELVDVVKAGEEVSLQFSSASEYESVEWSISDGAVYYSEKSVHIFTVPGRYLVSVSGIRNNRIVCTNEQFIDVLGSNKTLEFDDSRKVRTALFTEGRIVLNTVNNQNQSTFLFINNQLEFEKEVNSAEGINAELEMAFSLGDSVIAFSEQTTQSYTYLKYKSSEDGIEGVNAGIINYNDGLIKSQAINPNQLYIEYYNTLREKLWTRILYSQESEGSAHLISLNSRLYYLNFSGTEDAVYIEKFNNPSVIFNKQRYVFSAESEARELVFVDKNQVSNTICFALYNSNEDMSTLYSIDEMCNVRVIRHVPGRFTVNSIQISPVGDFTITTENSVVKYSKTWGKLAEYSDVSDDFGVCQLGDNLILLFENLPSGTIRLSYLDKNLQPVYLD